MSGVPPSRPASQTPALPDRALAALRTAERRRCARLRAWLYRRVLVLLVWLVWAAGCWTYRQALVAALPRLRRTPVPLPAPIVDEALVCLPSSRRLKEAELGRRSDWELTLMRNEPYARHGYRFGKGEENSPIYAYFARQPWYRPDTSSLDRCWERLSQVEKTNAFLLLRYQKQKRYGK